MLSMSKIKIGIITSLIVILGLLAWRYEASIKNAAQQAYQIVQQLQTIDDLQQNISKLEEYHTKTLDLIAESHREIQAARSEYREIRQNIQELRRENEEFRDWAMSNHPVVVNDLLHGKTRENNN